MKKRKGTAENLDPKANVLVQRKNLVKGGESEGPTVQAESKSGETPGHLHVIFSLNRGATNGNGRREGVDG